MCLGEKWERCFMVPYAEVQIANMICTNSSWRVTCAHSFDSLCVCSTLRSPSSPIQEEDEEKLSEMSDAQAHMLLSSSPAPTEVSSTARTTPCTRPV